MEPLTCVATLIVKEMGILAFGLEGWVMLLFSLRRSSPEIAHSGFNLFNNYTHVAMGGLVTELYEFFLSQTDLIMLLLSTNKLFYLL